MTDKTPQEECEERIKRYQADVQVAQYEIKVYEDAGLATYFPQMGLRHAYQHLQDAIEWKRSHTDEWGRWHEDAEEMT